MFRITFFVEDKNLGESFKRLVGIALNIEHAYVPNAEVSSHSGRASPQITGTPAIDAITKHLHELGGTINASKVRDALTGLGMNPNSSGYWLKNLQDQKRLRLVPNKSRARIHYEWVR